MIQNGLTPSYDLVGDLFRWICFKHDPAWTRRQKYQLLEHHESPQALIDWYDPHYENSTLNASQSSALKKAAEFLRASNHHCLVLGQTNYPPLLAQIADPPFVLYAIGDISLLVAPCILSKPRECTNNAYLHIWTVWAMGMKFAPKSTTF